jgi:hypothetical protein
MTNFNCHEGPAVFHILFITFYGMHLSVNQLARNMFGEEWLKL